MRRKEVSDFREGFLKERLDLLKASVTAEKVERRGDSSFFLKVDKALACTLAGTDYGTVTLLCRETLETEVAYMKTEDGKFELHCRITIDGELSESLSVVYVLGADVLSLFGEAEDEYEDIEAWKEKL